MPSKYFSVRASSCSATRSTSLCRQASASAFLFSGISFSTIFSPCSPSNWINRIRIRSITPEKSPSKPTGIFTATALGVRRSKIELKLFSKLAPILSNLFIKHIRGTLYLSAWRQTVSDCGSTPATPSKTTTPPSKTRSERSTSTVKSTCPGVSMMLMRYARSLWAPAPSYDGVQKQVVAADVMVIPRSRSCSIQSITASPSCTSPILCETPV